MSVVINGSTGIITPAIDLGTPLTVEDGGTGASSLTSLSLTSANISNSNITNPTISNAAITNSNISNAIITGTATNFSLITPNISNPSVTGTIVNVNLTNPSITGTILEDVFTIPDGAAFGVDPGNGSIQLITLTANRTPKAINFDAGEAVTLMVDDGTANTITWTDTTWGSPNGVVWITGSGVAPTLATTGYTTIVFWKVGTQVYGAKVG